MKFTWILAGLSTLLLHTSCSTKHAEAHEKTNFIATAAWQTDTTVAKEYVAQIHAYQHIELRALEKGYLQDIYVDEGQLIKKGQLMFRIMPLIYEAEMQKATAEVDYATIEYQNTKTLADKNIVSKNELAMAKASLDKARAELKLAKVHLGFTEIRAPFDGIMDRFLVRKGSLVDEGDLLTTLSDNSKMWVYFNVPESEYLDYMLQKQRGKQSNVRLRMANQAFFPNEGIIETIEADFNNETGNIAFRATFPNPNKLLRHGETGTIEMRVPFRNALLIPQKATFEILEKKYVFVIDRQQVVHQREVKISSEMPGLFVVSGGLKPTDKILLEGIRKVKHGDKISFAFKPAKDVVANLDIYVE